MGCLANPAQGKQRLTKEERGKGVEVPIDIGIPKGAPISLPLMDMLSSLDPIDAALIMDTLVDDFKFDWESAMYAFQHMEASSTEVLMRPSGHDQKLEKD